MESFGIKNFSSSYGSKSLATKHEYNPQVAAETPPDSYTPKYKKKAKVSPIASGLATLAAAVVGIRYRTNIGKFFKTTLPTFVKNLKLGENIGKAKKSIGPAIKKGFGTAKEGILKFLRIKT